MGIIGIGRPSDDMSIEDLVDLISKTNKMVEYLVNGRIDSKNVFEVGGWRVTLEQMASKDGDVGFSTEDTGADDIRIWAGDAKDGAPKFTVTKGGILTAISALFKSAAGYPRVEMNSQDGSIAAYQAADSYLKIEPDAFGSTPGISMHSSSADAMIYLLGTSLMLLTPSGQAQIQISSGENLDLFCNAGSGFKTRFNSWAAILNAYNGHTLQQDLDTLTIQGNTNMIDINTLFAYCNNLDMRLTAIGG